MINKGIVYMYIKLLMFNTIVATKENQTSGKAFKALRDVLRSILGKNIAVEERVVQLIPGNNGQIPDQFVQICSLS